MPIKKDETFTCEATAGGRTLIATVTQQDEKGTVSWEITEGIVALKIRNRTQELVSQYFDSNLGTTGAEVTCPENIEVKKGGVFECSAMIDGVKVTSRVEQQNDQGSVSYNFAGGIVSSEKLGIIVTAEMGAKNIKVKVDCGAPIRLSKPGSKFSCDVTDSKGQSGFIDVAIKDGNGDVNWNLRATEK
tara:strand:- start:184424 stop:184987 length:564 start_codon:yes stop_codon:yes gene_type:complete